MWSPFDRLEKLLAEDAANETSKHDFGRNIIPPAIARLRVFAYPFQDVETRAQYYWRDVGNVDAFYEANMELVALNPDLNIYDRQWPIWTYQAQQPPAKFVLDEDGRRGMAVNSMVAGGCIISGSFVRWSLLSNDVRIEEASVIDSSVLLPGVTVGRHCRITRSILDEGCVIPDGLQIGSGSRVGRAALLRDQARRGPGDAGHAARGCAPRFPVLGAASQLEFGPRPDHAACFDPQHVGLAFELTAQYADIGARGAPRPVQRRQRPSEQHDLRTTDGRGGMCRPGVDRDQPVGPMQKGHESRNRQIVRSVVQSRNVRKRCKLSVEMILRSRAEQYKRMPRVMFAQEAQNFGPALERPVFVVHCQAAQTSPHRALVADLHQNQRPFAEISRPQPGRKIGALGLFHFQIAARNNRIHVRAVEIEPLAREPGAGGRHDLRKAPPLLRGMLAGQQRVIPRGDNEFAGNPGAIQQRPGRIVAVAKPGSPHAARAQLPHDAPLIEAQPVRSLAAAHTL